MTSSIEFEYNGKVYQATLEKDNQGCSGCAFFTENNTCAANHFLTTDQDVVWKCASRGFIWEEKPSSSTETACNKSEPSVPMYTEQEIRDAYANWTGGTLETFIQELRKSKDPEYQKYLELKAKFGE